MKMSLKKIIGILLLGIIILIQFHATAYASMDPEQIKSLFDMYENNLGDINDLKKVIDQMYSDVNGATKVDDQLKATLKKDVQSLNNVSGIDANVVTMLSTQLNTEIDNLTDDNLSDMKEEVTTIKQWVDNKVATGSSSSTNTSTNTNTGTSTSTSTGTGTANTSTSTANNSSAVTNTTTTTSTVDNSNKQTTSTNTSDKTVVKSGIPHAGITNTAFMILAISVVAMIIFAIKCKGLKEIK